MSITASLVLSTQVREQESAPSSDTRKLNIPKSDLKRAYDVAKFSTASLGREDRFVNALLHGIDVLV